MLIGRTQSRAWLVATLLVAAIGTWATTATGTPPHMRHLRLVHSLPAKDTTLTAAPKALSLFFSENVKPAVAAVRLYTSDSTLVALGPLSVGAATAGTNAPPPLIAPVTGAMPAGKYRVQWRVTGADSHTITGEFSFTIRTPPPAP